MAGRKPFVVDDEKRRLVTAMAATGVPRERIAEVLKCGLSTLRNRFSKELHEAEEIANATVASFLFTAAKNGNVTAMIFWLKVRAGWKEPVQVQFEGPDLSRLSKDELKALDAILAKTEPVHHPAGGNVVPFAERGAGAASAD